MLFCPCLDITVQREVCPMQRHQLQFLRDWLQKSNRKPLVIRGARQVGKSTLVELFAQQSQKTLRNLNLERHPELSDIFSGKNPEQIIQQIEFLPKMGKIGNDTLLFLDEIQLVKNTPSVLKYLYDHYKIKFVVTGSSSYYLKNFFSESLSGRKKIFELYPLNFSEFLDFKQVAHKCFKHIHLSVL